MKTSIIIVVVFGLLAAGCSTTTYLSLTENDEEQIGQKLNDYAHDEFAGAELTISEKNGAEINGELLSVRDNALTICTERSASEEELASLKYRITIIQNDEIKEVTIEGSNYLWAGIGYGALGGALLGATTFLIASEGSTHITQGAASVIGALLGALAGAIIGGVVGVLSTDDFILQKIPPGYTFLPLKSLARYPDEEPEYLRAIK